MTDNLALWNAVSKTDPAHTKRVNQRGGFTAISAHYQVMAATAQFGPIGKGWGYDASDPILLGDVVTVGVTLWHGTRENKFGPVWGGADLKDSKGKFDSDAPKKAGTDGLTKALSQLGFNADVFLGRFDDNKYVEQVKAEFADKPQDNEPDASLQLALDGVAGCDTLVTLKAWVDRNWNGIPDHHCDAVNEAIKARQAAIKLMDRVAA